MAGKIKVYDKDFKALGSTSEAFNIAKTEELMREYTLSFSVVNTDGIFDYINENSIFEYSGQRFDISGIDGDSGTNNITQVTAEHISYRLSNYTLVNGYSFVGTARQLAEDILREAKTVDGTPASSEFTLGTVVSTDVLNFSLSGQTNVTAREALIAMKELGVEVQFDNFAVNVLYQVGADSGIVFEYGKNLTGVRRTWQRDNGWTYDINIADLQKTKGYTGESYGLGDNITVIDKFAKLEIKQRIITYKECDDPTQNSITVGVFIRDNASLSVETDRIANAASAVADEAKSKADTSVQQGEKYSNVSITHKDGFKCTNISDTLRVIVNAIDCFAVQTKKNGQWVTVTSAELWGVPAPRLTTQDAKNSYYATIGYNANGNPGFFLMRRANDGNFKEHFSVWPTNTGNTVLDCEGDLYLRSKTGGKVVIENREEDSQGFSGSIYLTENGGGLALLKFTNGILKSID